MRRRVVAAVAAVVLALVGSMLLARYVAVADERAMAGLEPVMVLVVTEPIAEGTAAEEIAGRVTTQAVPATAVSPGAVTSLGELGGEVATTELLPGEQLLAHRFAAPEQLADRRASAVPAGMHQVTIQLDAARVMGGHLSAGDTVGVFMSREPEPRETRLVLHKVLVTRVQGGIAAAAAGAPPAEPGAAEAESIPTELVMVTLAMDAEAAQKVVFAAEYERIWLSLEDPEAPGVDPGTVTRENLFP